MYATVANFFAHCDAGNEWRTMFAGEPVSLDVVFAIARVNRLRSRLQNEEFAGVSVLGPLDIHRRRLAGELRIVFFDEAGPAGQLKHLIVAQTEPVALRFDHFARARAAAVESVDHLHFFAAEPPADDWPRARLQVLV